MMAVRWLLIAVVGLAASDVSCQTFGDPPPLPIEGVRLYQGIFQRAIPNYAMIAARDFVDRDLGSMGHGNASRRDGLNDGLWCQSAANVGDIGSWKLPSGSGAPDDLNAEPIHMANRPGQVGLLRKGSIGSSPYQGMYTCTIPDENGVNQTLVVWAASNAAYDGTGGNPAAAPNPVVMEESFIPSSKPRDTDPPELTLSFNVSVAPPTYVTCQVDSTPVDVALLSREVAAGEYIPPSTESPVTNVTVMLRTREPGNYQCNVSVFRASGSNLTDAITSPIRISVTDKPTNVKSEQTGEHTVKLSWSAPASNIPPVAGYEVFYAVSGSSSTQSGGTTTANTTTISVTLPSLSSVYDFFVVAFSDADNALPSARSSNITVELKELGPCQAAGYHNCCLGGLCFGDSDELCYCDDRCFEFNDCCSDIHEIGCYEGPCQAAGYHNCCQAGLCWGDSDELCYCDAQCFDFNDCCSDIHEIGCYEVVPPTDVTTPPYGSQVDMNCGPVCLLAELRCLCEVTNGDFLAWMLRDLDNDIVGVATFSTSYPAGTTATFADGDFIATVTNSTEKMITSVVTGTVNQTNDGYTLQCIDLSTADSVGEEIAILDVPSQPENLTATIDATSGSVLLSWTPPINSSQCVVGYIITSTLPNSTVSISTTLNHVLFAESGAIPSCMYTASVAANDTAGRIGNWNQVLFSFGGSSVPTSGAQCPVAGQVFQSCASPCKATCSDPFPLCVEPCQPGYGCPSGHVVDQQKNKCVPLDSCPDSTGSDICQLPAQAGNCRARIKRYYYNVDVGKCQSFLYSGCNGNENNFKSLNECHKQCHKEAIDCSTVKCAVPTCPNPIHPNPDEGECCRKCPPGSTCPIKGQVYHECMGCPPTCDNYDKLVPCPAICVPGCACPHGKVFDEQRNACVYPEHCLGTCELNPEVGMCRGAFPRYFYNATSKQCEKFIYGGCGGNENNFETLLSCEKNCSECAPTCTPDFCKGKLQAKCNIPSEETHNTDSCFGECDETVCSACYYSNETLSMPTLEEDCPSFCPVDAKGEIYGMTCLRKWGKCVRSANLAAYGKPSKEMKTAENFKCWRPSCPSYG